MLEVRKARRKEGSVTKARVLYIEDDSASRRLVNRLLSSSGFEVVTAADGLEGVALAHKAQPNLILMDINLPSMDGRALTTRLRSSPVFSQTPIVALTAHRDSDDRKMALAAGCTGFLTKPIDVDTFPQQIESFLNGQKHKITFHDKQKHLERHTQELVCQLEAKVRELEKANQRMQELNELKSDFLKMASHDLKGPLDLTCQYLDVLEESFAKTDAELAENENMIHSLATRMKSGITRMRGVASEIEQVSQITSGLLELGCCAFHLDALVNQIILEFSDVCEQRQLKLIVADMSQVPSVEGDQAQLKTAVANIIGNAIKFTPDGGNIYVTAKVTQREIRLSVHDTGLGIPKEEQRYIFDLFYALGSVQNHSTSKSAFRGGGLGLGLPMAKGIVEAHNGRILVESHPQDKNATPGSTFTICLPLTC